MPVATWINWRNTVREIECSVAIFSLGAVLKDNFWAIRWVAIQSCNHVMWTSFLNITLNLWWLEDPETTFKSRTDLFGLLNSVDWESIVFPLFSSHSFRLCLVLISSLNRNRSVFINQACTEDKGTLMFSVRTLLERAHGCLRAYSSFYLLAPVPRWLLPFSLPVCL